MTRRELVRGCYEADKKFLSNTENTLHVTAISIQFSMSGLGRNFMKSFLSDNITCFSPSENVPFFQQQADTCPSSISTQGFILFVSSVTVWKAGRHPRFRSYNGVCGRGASARWQTVFTTNPRWNPWLRACHSSAFTWTTPAASATGTHLRITRMLHGCEIFICSSLHL